MILSFISLVAAAILVFALLPLLFIYSGWSFFFLGATFFVASWFLLCYVGHAQAFLLDYIRKRRQH
jgi:hypothetical protein